MKKIINYLKNIGYYIGIILIIVLFISILNLFGISKNVTTIIGTLLMITTFLILGFIHGKKANSKGFITGLKLGIAMILILLIFNLLFLRTKLTGYTYIYFIILLLSSAFGGTIGINKKK